jgi:hypothetical protein
MWGRQWQEVLEHTIAAQVLDLPFVAP